MLAGAMGAFVVWLELRQAMAETPALGLGGILYVVGMGIGAAVFFAGFLLALVVAGRRRLARAFLVAYAAAGIVAAVATGDVVVALLLPFTYLAAGGLLLWLTMAALLLIAVRVLLHARHVDAPK